MGTEITMKSDFYRKVFNRENITISVPRDDEQAYIMEKIRRELSVGIILEETRTRFPNIARRMMKDDSIEGLILGRTEIPLLLTEETLGIPFLIRQGPTLKVRFATAFQPSPFATSTRGRIPFITFVINAMSHAEIVFLTSYRD